MSFKLKYINKSNFQKIFLCMMAIYIENLINLTPTCEVCFSELLFPFENDTKLTVNLFLLPIARSLIESLLCLKILTHLYLWTLSSATCYYFD